jgi:ribosomal protein S18 acetylase RimI-like enzyme
MNIVIKEASIEDINNGLLEVYIEGYRYHQNGRPDIFINVSNDTLKEDLIKGFEEFKYLIAIENEKVVGYLAYKIKEKHSKKLHVDQIIVSEVNRRKGIGKKLMNFVEQIANKEDCDRIELDCWTFNQNAINMYEYIGFDRQRIMYEKKIK